MVPVYLSYKIMSEVIWKKIFEKSLHELYGNRDNFFNELKKLDALRSGAEYNTGSITTSSAWCLLSASNYFMPKKVLEVGTFIGKSTYAIAHGSGLALSKTSIHTCDLSNDIKLDLPVSSEVICYPKTSSTDMFRAIQNQGLKDFEMMHVDGRLQADDFPLIEKLLTDDAVILLDDFEGIEKGVANVFNFGAQKKLNKYLIVYPPETDFLNKYGFHDCSTTSILLPKQLLQLTAQ